MITVGLLGSLAGFAPSLGAAEASGGPTTALISRATGLAGAKGNGLSNIAAISARGRYVAFSSEATNLDPADPDSLRDVFVRDGRTGVTTLVSRAAGAAGAKGNGHSGRVAISANGRYVAFSSLATNLDPADADATDDVFVRDLVAATTTLVSRAAGAGGAKSNGLSFFPAISADGRSVAFESQATNLHPADTDAAEDVFVRDVVAGTTTLVSRATGATGVKGNVPSYDAQISADGRHVTFSTQATNLDPADTDAADDVFVRDLMAATTTLVSRASGAAGAKANGVSSAYAQSSADGRFVAFSSRATNLDPADTDIADDVYVRDLVSATTTLVSRAGAAGLKGDGASINPTISGDGRSVAFESRATNLDPADVDATADVFVRDLVAATTALVSRADGVAGTESNGSNSFPSISADGRSVAFSSQATNLDLADTDATYDVFVRTLSVPGYWMVASDGGIFSFDAPFSGSTGDVKLNQPIVGMAADPDGKGYWFVAADGGIFAFDATFAGSLGGTQLNLPIVGMAPTPSGPGYWLVAGDGGIFAFGDALFSGSTGDKKLNKPIVGMAADPDGRGYWFVASDGGIFAFDATFAGSLGATPLNRPVVGMAADPDGRGYWLVASDGGIFSFDAAFFGSTGAVKLNQPIVGMAADPNRPGYWFVAADGGIFSFNAGFQGSLGATKLNKPVVGMAAA